jgi:hypothetical protein
MISHYQSLASEVGGKVIILVSNPSKKNERLTGSGQVITPQFVKERFAEMFGDSIEVRISEQSPVRDCYEFGSEITEGTVLFGCANKDKDIERFDRIKDYYKEKNPLIKVKVSPFNIKTQISASDIRQQM